MKNLDWCAFLQRFRNKLIKNGTENNEKLGFLYVNL